MNVDALIPGGINGGRGTAVVDEGEPAGVAMSEDVDRAATFFMAHLFDEFFAVLSNLFAEPGILIGNSAGG